MKKIGMVIVTVKRINLRSNKDFDLLEDWITASTINPERCFDTIPESIYLN